MPLWAGFIEVRAYDEGIRIFGIRLVGVSPENGVKLLLTLGFISIVLVVGNLVRFTSRRLLRQRANVRVLFWTRQGINLAVGVVLVFGVGSIWFNDPRTLAAALGLITAGLAFALQRVVTSIAAYFVLLRGKIFTEPVYNYTREFGFIWEEMALPIRYDADRERAEQLLLEAARRHHVAIEKLHAEEARELQRRYFVVHLSAFEPKVYYRLTDNWLELTVRFVTRAEGVREVKDAMSRKILAGLDDAGIEVASQTVEVVGLPPLRVR